MLSIMPSGYFVLRRTAAILLLIFATHWAHATQASTKSAADATVVVDALGKGTFALNGPWQFHPGDDYAWASPTFDDSHWERVTADRPWGKQSHAHLTGFAWYRCSVTLPQGADAPQEISLLVPGIRDSYEIYWNGSLIGHNGRLPPHPVWYISQAAQTFELGHVRQGVLAVRV